MPAQRLAQLGDSDDEHEVEEQLERGGATLLVGIVDGPQVRRAAEDECSSRTSFSRGSGRRNVRIVSAVARRVSHGLVRLLDPL
jgi:hypothetical protein